ncbi:MAG: ABC transporter ATP-binding protein [Prolixibacteraceae bacterium]|nr:ABC transporter ATP-binding protein [Prolixibacteraceae bacterium]MBN2648107.1 ABC transporter ATP-binding protein [Prolixibacteraceae bacterium]
MKHYLNVENLVCGYPGNFNLKQISFCIEQGAFAGIIGPNGSGKTTLFKGIAGDLNIKSGSIQLNNTDLSQIRLKEKAQKIAVVTQYTEITDMSVEEYVLMGRTPYRPRFSFFETKNDMLIAEKYMKLTNTLRLRHKPMTELSGGEQQLAAIARALTQEPELLLLDEPTSHLDITHQVQILNLIQQLNHNLRLTVLLIIHDLNMAGEYCDFLIMMKDGAIHAIGQPADVLNYQTIEEVYQTVVVTRENPVSKKPVVFLVSEKVLNEQARKNTKA